MATVTQTKTVTKTLQPPKKTPKLSNFQGQGFTTSESEMSGGDDPPPPKGGPKSKPKPKRVSPRKKLIDDSPPPEDTLDPFPPERLPMLVTNKPAVRNRYGEKVPAPVDPDQKLRQAINFLSDMGPENFQEFEEKLDELEKWLRKNHPNWEGVTKGGKANDPEMLARRAEWMVWAHRNKIREGSEQWFVREQFPGTPSMQKSQIAPPGKDRWQVLKSGVQLGAPKYPKLQVMLAEEKKEVMELEKARREKVAKEGKEGKTGTAGASKQVNAWDEPLPRPEVWHRKEARDFFPFGETPYMEQLISREIHADLQRGAEARARANESWVRPLFRATLDWFRGKPEDFVDEVASPWKLPAVEAEEVEQFTKDHNTPAAPAKAVKRTRTKEHSKAGSKQQKVK